MAREKNNINPLEQVQAQKNIGPDEAPLKPDFGTNAENRKAIEELRRQIDLEKSNQQPGEQPTQVLVGLTRALESREKHEQRQHRERDLLNAASGVSRFGIISISEDNSVLKPIRENESWQKAYQMLCEAVAAQNLVEVQTVLKQLLEISKSEAQAVPKDSPLRGMNSDTVYDSAAQDILLFQKTLNNFKEEIPWQALQQHFTQ